MPTYEYVCTDCKNQWEEIQKISEDPIQVCPKCGKSTAKRQISGGNFILKGGGWYADLYSSTPKGGGDKGGAANGAGTTTEAKPAEKKAESTAPKADTSKSSGSSGSGSGGSSSSS
ncbi:MAG: zinc ribbon domain-containing protein [Deltaproteobacteria bacterium]|nr:zinc ribbon domain-containing protein [Deltaproteobacteria bacterium]